MKKYGPKRILETKYLYCNKHGECEHVLSGIKNKRWKCCACTVKSAFQYMKRRKVMAIEYKGGRCEICSYDKSMDALTFHHKNPLLKSYHLSGTNLCKKWQTLILELDKCRLLCANCHFETHEMENKERIKANERPSTDYHRKEIHKINCKKLGKKPSF